MSDPHVCAWCPLRSQEVVRPRGTRVTLVVDHNVGLRIETGLSAKASVLIAEPFLQTLCIVLSWLQLHHMAQAGLEFVALLLPLLPGCWDFRHE